MFIKDKIMTVQYTVGTEATHFTGVEGMITGVRLYEDARAEYEFTCLMEDGLNKWFVQACELEVKKRRLGFSKK